MQHSFSLFLRSPGGENEGGGNPPEKEAVKPEETPSTEVPEEKGFIDKVKDALQDWSTEDQAEQDLDDRTP